MTGEDLRTGALRALPLAHGGSRDVPLYVVLVKGELAGPAAHTALECFQRHAPVEARRSKRFG